MKTKRIQNQKKTGFSLVELLIVITVIGFLAAIAVPALSSTGTAARVNTAKRNAQSLCSLYSNARSVGAEFTSATKEGIAGELIEGRSGVDVAGSHFRMSPIGEDELALALTYCSFDSDSLTLSYHEDGVLEEEQTGGWSSWQDWFTVENQTVEHYLALIRAQVPPDQYQFQAIPANPGYSMIQVRHFISNLP